MLLSILSLVSSSRNMLARFEKISVGAVTLGAVFANDYQHGDADSRLYACFAMRHSIDY
ncbi:hypothetical protein [Cysteiniphilum halobium]|uniref:hypothetical protein n=1 Tax=Cysteiniphilum halobium TaxID=2219059 RepID=UPI0013C33F03|nr:hypothetical protein [Cysteiniphilum halobium]